MAEFDIKSFLDKTAYLDEPPKPAPPQVGPGETFVNRGANAIPLGRLVTDSVAAAALNALRPEPSAVLTPEARAELEAMGEAVPEAPERTLVEDYRDIRDTRRVRTEAGSEQNPNAARAGTALGLTASILAPLPKATLGGTGVKGRVLSAAATGAGYGALSGLTDGEADLTRGEVGQALKDTAEGAVVGGVIGAGAAGAAEAARPLAGTLRKYATEQARRTIQGGSDISAATRKPLSSEAADEILTSGGIRPFSTTQATAERIEALAAERGAVYGKILDELESLGVQGPRAKELADQIYRRYLEEYPNYVSSKTIPEIYKRVAENVDDAARPGPAGVVEGPERVNLGLRQTERIKQDLQDVAKFERLNANPSNETFRELASTVRQANEDAISAAGAAAPEGSRLRQVADSFVPVKAQLARTLEARHFSRPAASKAQQRSNTNLKDLAVGLTASGGEPVSGLAMTQLASAGRNRGPSTLASGAFNLSEGLRTGSLSQEVAAGLAGGAELAADEARSRANRATIDERTDAVTAALIRALRTRKGGGDKKDKRDNPKEKR